MCKQEFFFGAGVGVGFKTYRYTEFRVEKAKFLRVIPFLLFGEATCIDRESACSI